MLNIVIRVSQVRDTAGIVEIAKEAELVARDFACTRSDPRAARKSNNPTQDPRRPGGHAPIGRYELVARGPTPIEAQREYGDQLLLFEPTSGIALDAESYGRFGLLMYSGAPGSDLNLRRTQGGVRLSPQVMKILLDQLGENDTAELSIEALKPRSWWAFWRRNENLPRLSTHPPQFDAPPFDEATLLEQLRRTAVRRPRATRDDTGAADRWRDRDSGSESSSSSPAEFRGGGGGGGGGGATGSWAEGSAGRGPGVSAAGVILGAAGIAAVAAAASGERDNAHGGTTDGNANADEPTDATTPDSAAEPASSLSSGTSY